MRFLRTDDIPPAWIIDRLRDDRLRDERAPASVPLRPELPLPVPPAIEYGEPDASPARVIEVPVTPDEPSEEERVVIIDL